MLLSEPQSKWSELPLEILIRLAKLVSTTSITLTFSCTIQFLLFRAVCKSWRSALPIDKKYDDALVFCYNPIPISAPPPSFFETNCYWSPCEYYSLAHVRNGSFYLVRSTACILQSIKSPSCSRLLIVDHLGDDFNKVCCRKQLFTSYNRSNGWDISSPRSLNLLDYRVSVVAEEYNLRFLVNDKGVLRLQDSDKTFWRKAVLICNMNTDEELDGVAVVLFNEKLCQYSFADSKWMTVNILDDRGFRMFSSLQDMVRYDDGCIAAIDCRAAIFLLSYDFNSRTFGVTRHATELKFMGLDCRRLVVNSDTGELYLVEKNDFHDELEKPKLSFTIRRFSGYIKNWMSVRSTPGWIMFVGGDFAFSASGDHFPMICSGNGNCLFTGIRSFRRDASCPEAEFLEIADDRCVFHFGEFCADSITNSNFIWCKNDYNPIFSSPENWEELYQPPSHCPQRLLEQSAVPMAESKSDANSGGYPSLPEDVNIVPESREKLMKEKGKKCRSDSYGSGHSESSYNSRGPKTRKIAHGGPSTEHMRTKEVQLELIQNLAACVTRLISNPVEAQSDQPGCSFGEVVKDLGSLPNVEAGSDFYFASCPILQKAENREAYMSLGSAEVKYKWLKYMLIRSGWTGE